MELTDLIQHPEKMDRDTLYELRSQLALYPYFQTVRLLLLQNLYLLHDPTFDEELRRAAVYITDRRVLFEMVEAAHFRITPKRQSKDKEGKDRTLSLIDNFLVTLPEEDKENGKGRRRPTPADATVDYVAYLLESEGENEEKDAPATPQLNGQDLIDDFINNGKGKIVLNEHPQFVPQTTEGESGKTDKEVDEGYFTETLARIYIKQGRYGKALEIIRRLNANFPQKNAYFADQIRFLEKLIINNNNNK